ncbi:sulfurtransferase [Aquitalea sp. S1-19]|nr:sulfurtransferase [Aquitalea sp. S1-19]
MKTRTFYALAACLLPWTLAQAASQVLPLDTRASAYFNGWPEAGAKQGGHYPGAVNLAASWLGKLDDAQLQALLARKGIAVQQPLGLYGAGSKAVAARLGKLGYRHISYLPNALADTAKLKALPNYQALVPAFWLHDLQQGKPVTAAPAKGWKLFEVGWSVPKAYLLSHIPGAGYIDTNTLESEPLWNKVDDKQLEATLLAQGITSSTPVILYGRDTLMAARAAHILMLAGVKDVRILDGGYPAWSAADYPVARGLPPTASPAANWGGPFPGKPEYLVSLADAKALLKSPNGRLASIRSWAEFTGETSGYSYIKPKGDIPGAAWGHGGVNANDMSDFRNPDHTMRSADEIAAFWREAGILPEQRVAFYCGTGWRASEAFFYAYLMGWKQPAVYDGGWMEWSSDPANPVVRGERPIKP